MSITNFMGRPYRPRLIDHSLEHALRGAGAVIIEGARATGKTSTALNAARSHIFLDDAQSRQLLEVSPSSVLEGESPRLLDEWQVAPDLWNMVRRSVDASAQPGHYILTGSSVPADDVTRHTGAGRFLRLRQRTMTWFEKSPEGDRPLSIAGLFDGDRPAPQLSDSPRLDEVIDGVLTSGFPAMTHLESNISAQRLRAYIDDVARTDVRRLADVRHEPGVLKQLIAALARSVASDVTHKTLAADVRAVAPSIDAETISKYLNIFERLFLVELQQSWTPALRSRARLRTSPKLHLADAALAAAAIGAAAPQLKRDLQTLGVLFESAVVHDLTVFASILGGEVRHFRDSNGKEIDAVITLPDGRWGAVEIKLGGAQLTAGATSLANAVAQIDTLAVGEPAFRMVVTGTGPILTTDDDTVTAPLSALAP